jgi:curved DNA-binding protein CbpA
MSNDPFSVLGLPARRGLSDDDVRAAWRRIAAATHPDRDDGGNPAAFGRAATAYATLRTTDGRGEALADLGPDDAAGKRRTGGHARVDGLAAGPRRLTGWVTATGRHSGRRRLPVLTAGQRGRWRVPVLTAGQRGRRRLPVLSAGQPGLLAMRLAGAGIASLVAFLIAGWSPASIGVLAGIVTWLVASRWHRLGGSR